MTPTDAKSETRAGEVAPFPLGQMTMVERADPTTVLSRPEVAQTIRLATARVVDSDLDRYEGLRGVMVGRAYSIAYQALGRYEEKDGSLLGWLSQKVQAGLREDFA
jgi:hypothetical protein